MNLYKCSTGGGWINFILVFCNNWDEIVEEIKDYAAKHGQKIHYKELIDLAKGRELVGIELINEALEVLHDSPYLGSYIINYELRSRLKRENLPQKAPF